MDLISSPTTTLQRRLQIIVRGQSEKWLYSIFWQPSKDGNGNAVLKWADGHFRAGGMNGRQVDATEMSPEGNVTDSEWFFTLSSTRSFSAQDSTVLSCAFSSGAHVWLAGQQELQFYGCDRVQEAQLHGIQTLVFVPTPNGVVELGSSHLIGQDWGMVQIAKMLFGELGSEPNQNQKRPPQLGFGSDVIKTEWTGFDINYPDQSDEFDVSKPVLGRSSSGSGRSDMEDDKSNRSIKKRLRKPEKEPAPNHVQAERQRREKLNRRFYALRSVVPYVSKMDKASLLADAVTYIGELKTKLADLETKLEVQDSKKSSTMRNLVRNRTGTNKLFGDDDKMMRLGYVGMEVEVKIVGSEALIRAHGKNVNHPAARLTGALKDLGLPIRHASMSDVRDVLVQDVVVRVAEGIGSEEATRTSILTRMLHN